MSLKTSRLAQATVTPLASIFGSGFLVIVPILAGAVGKYSVFAMAVVCAVAVAVGGVIRFNIRHAEPVLARQPPESTLGLERSSDLALVFAYIISVSLYLHILSAFVLAGLGHDAPIAENLLTTAVIVLIAAVGVIKGLDLLESLESWALYVTLAIIVLLLVGFGHYDLVAWRSAAGIQLPASLKQSPWQISTIIAGTLIVVQGFETPRYMGDEFDADTRIAASRRSQVISTVVYLIFVALATPMLHLLNGHYNDDSLIALAGFASGLLAMPLVAAAALSQFSAAVADTMAATGNLQEVTHHHLKQRWGYILVGGGAVMLTWSANTYEIVALASRAFAFYYLLQCLVAISVSRSTTQRVAFGLVAVVLGFITVFAVPAS